MSLHQRWVGAAVAAAVTGLVFVPAAGAEETPRPVDVATAIDSAPAVAEYELSDLHRVGTTKRLVGKGVRLVGPGTGLMGGAVYTPETVDVSAFNERFAFEIGNGCADGIAAVVQGQGADAIGGGGGTIGYASGNYLDGTGFEDIGIEHSLAVEIDTWQNIGSDFGPDGIGDPKVPHVSVQTRGVQPNEANPLYSLASHRTDDVMDRTLHRARVRFETGVLRMYVDGHRRVRVEIDLGAQLGLTDSMAYVGLTAGGGGCSAPVDVLRFRLNLSDAS